MKQGATELQVPAVAYPRRGWLAALLLGAALGAAGLADLLGVERREGSAATGPLDAVHHLEVLAARMERDLLDLYLALHQPNAAPTAIAQAEPTFRREIEALRATAPSAIVPGLLRLYRLHDEIVDVAHAIATQPAVSRANAIETRVAILAAAQRAEMANLRQALERRAGEHRDQTAPLPVPVVVLFATASLLLMVIAWLFVQSRSARPARRARAPGLNLGHLQDALHHIADWILVCAADGNIEQVLAARDDQQGGASALLGQSIWRLTSNLHSGALPPPGPGSDGAVVALTLFGATPETAIPVRLVLARLGAHAPHRILAVARDRRDEIGIEQSLHDNARRLFHSRADVERLRETVLYVAEEEQERIGRELHDGAGQQLAGIAFLTHALADRLEPVDASASADLRWLSGLAGRTAESVRGLCRQLGSSQFEHADITALLRQLCEDAKVTYGVDCRFDHCDDSPELDAQAKRHVFRLAQESLNNALRHGNAHEVRMRLDVGRHRFRLAIADDGIGFDPRRFAGVAQRGLGLHSMRTRATIIGGNLRIRSGSRGTLVLLTAPTSDPH